MGKLLTLSLANLWENAVAVLGTYVLFIYEDIHYVSLHYITNPFFKMC